MLLEVSRPGLYLPRPASPWSSKQNSPEETLTAASQVFQNQRKRSPSPRSPPHREARPRPLARGLTRLPSQGWGQLTPSQGWAPRWSRMGAGGGGNGCSVLQNGSGPRKRQARRNLSHQKPEREEESAPQKENKGVPASPPPPNRAQVTKVGAGRGEERDSPPGSPVPSAPFRSQGRGSLPPHPPWRLTHFS